MSLLVPSADLGFCLDLLEAEGTGDIILGLAVVGLCSLVLALCWWRKPAEKPSVIQLPSGLRVSHGGGGSN